MNSPIDTKFGDNFSSFPTSRSYLDGVIDRPHAIIARRLHTLAMESWFETHIPDSGLWS